MGYELNQVKQSSEELRNNLEQFWGTENYFTNPLVKYKYTDGVKYFAEHAGAYWLLQEINGLYVKLGCPVFLNIVVKSNKKKADIIVDDGNDKVLIKKHIGFTDLPEGEWQFFLTDNVLMVPSEY